MTTSVDFADAWRKITERAAYIRAEWEIWGVVDPNAPKRKKGSMTAFDLVPPWEQTKLVCMIAAGEEYPVYYRLYYETSLDEVWEALALQKAARWTPPPPREPTRPR